MHQKQPGDFKHEVRCHFYGVIQQKISLLQKALQDLIESTHNETKSSAGDKYETGRAMLQIEQDNLRKQLQQVMQQKKDFDNIPSGTDVSIIKKGSLVRTDKGYFFISVALGKLILDGLLVVAISPQSPLGKQLIELKTLGKVSVNGVCYIVEGIE